MEYREATKKRQKMRLALSGPSGCGKTYTALIAATVLAGDGGRVAVLDTEHGSASLYSDKFKFDVLDLAEPFHPDRYIEAIRAAESAGYQVVIIDSLSHAWKGPGGILDLHDQAKKKPKYGGNSYAAWGEVTPIQNRMIEAIIGSRIHVIATMRSKMDYAQEKDEKSGRKTIRKLGLAPIQRDDTEYEFTIWGEMTIENDLMISKSRYDAISGKMFSKPGPELFGQILGWLQDGEPATEAEAVLQEEGSADVAEEYADPTPLDDVQYRALVQTLGDALGFENEKELSAPAQEGFTAGMCKALLRMADSKEMARDGELRFRDPFKGHYLTLEAARERAYQVFQKAEKRALEQSAA